MPNNRNFARLAADSRSAALALERAGRSVDAQQARADAIRYERYAQLERLGAVRMS